jgi:prepilin-type processing-associated H-X9-DG protein
MAQARFKMLECPSANLYGGSISALLVAPLFQITPGSCAEGSCTVQVGAFGTGANLGLTNYLGVNGSRGNGSMGVISGSEAFNPYYARYTGLFNNRSQVSIAQIPDGTSNTLMFGEAVGNDDGSTLYRYTWMGFGSMGTWKGLGGPSNPVSWGQFSSRHAGGVLFCFADGSVRVLHREGTAPTTFTTSPPVAPPGWFILQSLAGYQDGDVVDLGGIS